MDKIVKKICKHHGLTDYILECRGTRYRCKECRSKNVSKHRKRRKKQLIELFGGKCFICDYSRCVRALHFHHKDPATKEFSIAEAGECFSKEKLFAEAAKCVLVCANCHAEIEDGMLVL